MTGAHNIRQRARDDFLKEVRTVAHQHLAQPGPHGLALRAVARDIGMAPSALYRYFSSREALLSALVDDTHHSAADFIEQQIIDRHTDDPAATWRTTCHALRTWAHAHPHEFALLYSPDPAVPQPTGPAAQRIPQLLEINLPTRDRTLSEDKSTADTTPRQALAEWAQLIGVIIFELRGDFAQLRGRPFPQDSRRIQAPEATCRAPAVASRMPIPWRSSATASSRNR